MTPTAILHLCLGLAVALGLSSCAKGNSTPPGPSNTASPTAPSIPGTKLCTDVPSCHDGCVNLYPYVDPSVINNYYSSRGLYYSSARIQALADNEKNRNDQATCLAKTY